MSDLDEFDYELYDLDDFDLSYYLEEDDFEYDDDADYETYRDRNWDRII